MRALWREKLRHDNVEAVQVQHPMMGIFTFEAAAAKRTVQLGTVHKLFEEGRSRRFSFGG